MNLTGWSMIETRQDGRKKETDAMEGGGRKRKWDIGVWME